MHEPRAVDSHKLVTLQYSLRNGDGVTIREPHGAPIRYVHGVGQLFSKLETALAGHRPGDVLRVKLFPGDAFGERDLDLVIDVPRDDLPAGEPIEVGGPVIGAASDGTQVRFTVTAIEADRISLDGNHPLAGQTLVFELEIQGVRDATEAEIEAARQQVGGAGAGSG
ncbi:MAG: hypothetical protein B7Z66_06835 [Chromatiales bacterium 21-64-14]|nr:MAG: hypothetical protein B7Z66_06835 [Chromatiales bacterium 21-64-14]HQU16701.1 peptidylprolyl isomerase [Gammaproteobacteria bacterium]